MPVLLAPCLPEAALQCHMLPNEGNMLTLCHLSRQTVRNPEALLVVWRVFILTSNGCNRVLY